MKEDLIIRGGTVLTMDPGAKIIEDGLVRVGDGKILAVEKNSKNFVAPAGAKVIEANGCLVLPGLINGHTHSPMSLFRGFVEEMNLQAWLGKVFPAEQKFGTREFIYDGTLLSALEMIRTGTTLCNDMYYHEDEVAKACQQAGMRVICGQTFIETHPGAAAASPFETIDECLAQVKKYPLAIPAVAPHSVYSLSEKTFIKVMEFAVSRGLRIHTHLSETQLEVDEFTKRYGKSPVEYLESMGFWKEKVIAAHATCLSEKDIRILGENRVGISHNPESNLKLGSKISPVTELKRAGAHVALGTDSCASNNNLDIFREADFAAKLQSHVYGPGAFTAKDTVRMLTSEGAKAMGLGDELGSLEVGKAADVIAVDINRYNAVPMYDPYTHLIYSANGEDVRHSIIDGRVVMQDFKVLTLDERTIVSTTRKWAQKISAP